MNESQSLFPLTGSRQSNTNTVLGFKKESDIANWQPIIHGISCGGIKLAPQHSAIFKILYLFLNGIAFFSSTPIYMKHKNLYTVLLATIVKADWQGDIACSVPSIYFSTKLKPIGISYFSKCLRIHFNLISSFIIVLSMSTSRTFLDYKWEYIVYDIQFIKRYLEVSKNPYCEGRISIILFMNLTCFSIWNSVCLTAILLMLSDSSILTQL